MQKKNTQYSCYGHTDHGKETGADLLLSAFEILIKYVKKNKQINGFNIEIQVFETEKSEFTGMINSYSGSIVVFLLNTNIDKNSLQIYKNLGFFL